jgi:hypothetical protein
VSITSISGSCQALLQLIALELEQVPQRVNVELELSPEPLDPDCDDFELYTSEQKGDRYWIPWTEEVGAWVAVDGRQVVLVLSQDYDGHTLKGRLMAGLSSVITGACLNLQGLVAIHANAVCLAERGVAFVGSSGQGKSTLSAYCASQGAGFITDDVLIVDAQGMTHPGNPRIKLYPETGERLGFPTPDTPDYKIYYNPTQIGAYLIQSPVILSAIYFPQESPDGRIYSEKIAPGQAVFDLIQQSYYASELVTTHTLLFDEYVRLAAQVPIKMLYYPRDFSRLVDVYQFLLRDLNL